MKNFKEHVMEYEKVDFDSVSIETVETCLRDGTRSLKKMKAIKRQCLFITKSIAVLILILAVFASVNFRYEKYGFFSFQAVLVAWDLYLLNETANDYSELKKEMAELKEFVELMSYIKSVKIEQAVSEEQA